MWNVGRRPIHSQRSLVWTSRIQFRRAMTSKPLGQGRRSVFLGSTKRVSLGLLSPCQWENKRSKLIDGRTESCQLLIATQTPSSREVDTFSWYEVWEQATAISYMCISAGKIGISRGNGMLDTPARCGPIVKLIVFR